MKTITDECNFTDIYELNHEGQVVVVTIYHFTKNRFWAFKQMQLGIEKLRSIKGLEFSKILGTGAGNGFSVFPNFGQYAILTVWRKKDDALQYFVEDTYQQEFSQKANSRQHYWLSPTFGHGKWDGKSPFRYSSGSSDSGAVAVITRATIRTSRMIEFWRHVPSISRSMVGEEGLQLAVGIGEWPLVQQATFSVWDSWESMKNFAYRKDLHKEVIQKTKARRWYSEELFARFSVIKVEYASPNTR